MERSRPLQGITGYGKRCWSAGNFRMLCLGSGTDPHDACCCGYITCGLGLLHLADPRGDGSIMGAELFHFLLENI